jgi:hypothetical protein
MDTLFHFYIVYEHQFSYRLFWYGIKLLTVVDVQIFLGEIRKKIEIYVKNFYIIKSRII